MQADSLHYDPEMASNFAIQSEDFPALPGSHTTSLNPLRHNNDVCQAALPHAGVVASMYGPAASPVLERGQTDDRKQSSSYGKPSSEVFIYQSAITLNPKQQLTNRIRSQLWFLDHKVSDLQFWVDVIFRLILQVIENITMHHCCLIHLKHIRMPQHPRALTRLISE